MASIGIEPDLFEHLQYERWVGSSLEERRRHMHGLSRVVVEGGEMTMVDGAVRDDPVYVDEAMFPLFGVGLIRGRGCHCRTGGDGVFPVSGTAKGSDLILVAVNFE